jgi:hypothetical protein
VQARLAQRRRVLLELRVEILVAAPELIHEDVVQNLGGVDQLGERFLIA